MVRVDMERPRVFSSLPPIEEPGERGTKNWFPESTWESHGQGNSRNCFLFSGFRSSLVFQRSFPLCVIVCRFFMGLGT